MAESTAEVGEQSKFPMFFSAHLCASLPSIGAGAKNRSWRF